MWYKLAKEANEWMALRVFSATFFFAALTVLVIDTMYWVGERARGYQGDFYVNDPFFAVFGYMALYSGALTLVMFAIQMHFKHEE